MRYQNTKPEDYRRVRDTTPIAYLPWGAHEWHALHNPLGLDTLKAEGHCLALCAETGGIVFPGVYCGHQTMKPHAGFDSTLEFSAGCVKLLAREYLQQLSHEGFKVVVIVLGHYGPDHVQAIQETVSEFNASQPDTVAWAFPDYQATREEGFMGDHAGLFETSYMMFFRPELVDLSRLPAGELEFGVDGCGPTDPREASSKTGRDSTNALVKNAAPKILSMLQEKTG